MKPLGLLSETASLRLRLRDVLSVAQSVGARTFCVDFTYFHIHCEIHCEMKCEMVQSFHSEITFPAHRTVRQSTSPTSTCLTVTPTSWDLRRAWNQLFDDLPIRTVPQEHRARMLKAQRRVFHKRPPNRCLVASNA